MKPAAQTAICEKGRKLCTDTEIEVNSNCSGGDDENQFNGVRASVTLEGDLVSLCLET